MIELIFVRHGQTDWNLEKRLQGIKDIPLNKTGISEAVNLRDNLSISIDSIISSDLKRAYKTAEILNETYKLPISTDERIRERDFGELAGEKAEFSHTVDRDLYGVEVFEDFDKRLLSFLEDMTSLPAGRHMVVCHGGVISEILKVLSNGELHWKTHPISNCSLTSLTFDGNTWSIDYFGKKFNEENLTKESIYI